MDTRDWNPVHKGEIYCSPACGANCLFEAYTNAVDKASELAQELGPDWEPIVHENIGWYWYVKHKTLPLKINKSLVQGYNVYYNFRHKQFLGSGKSPIKALLQAYIRANECYEDLLKELKIFEAILMR